MKTLPRSMMIALRGRRGLEENDTSQNGEIMAMSPESQVRQVVAWNLGDNAWANWFATVVRETGADIKKL